jgi:hypothetical protein
MFAAAFIRKLIFKLFKPISVITVLTHKIPLEKSK